MKFADERGVPHEQSDHRTDIVDRWHASRLLSRDPEGTSNRQAVDALTAVADPVGHGSWSAINEHFRRGEPLCEQCRAKKRAVNRGQAERRRRANGVAERETPTCPSVGAWHAHKRDGSPPCSGCVAAIRLYNRDRVRAKRAAKRAADLSTVGAFSEG